LRITKVHFGLALNFILQNFFKNDKKTGKFTNVFTKREDNLANVVSIIQDKDGYIWTTSWQYGVNRFSPNNERMIYLNKEDDPNSISFNSVTAICEDQAGIIWIATAGYGINKADKKKIKFAQVTKESNNTNSLVSNYITAIYKNNDNKIWLGNGEGKGLNMYDSVTRKYCVFAYNPADPNSFPDPQGNVYAIEKDSRGTLWIGSRGGLIQIIDKNPPAYFSASNIHFKNYYHNSKNSNSLNSNVVRAIFADKNYLWIGTDGGLHKLNLNDYYLNNGKQPIFEKFINIADDNKSISDNRIRKIIQDKNGYLWIATAKGLNKYNPQNNEFTQFLRDTTIKNSINQDYIWALCSDADGNIWVGTNGGGLNKIDGKTGIISHFTEKEGLINNGIRGLILDKNNNLWITTNKGLSMFNTKNQTFKNYKVKDGLVGNDFNGGAYFIHNNGEIFIGGNNGYNHFFPDQITENAYEPSVVLTDFQILNKNVEISDNSPIQQSISFAKKITLSYVDYVFSFEFSSLHYSSPEENKYKYMLEGFDNDWIYTDASKRFATYTNLDPGTYIFKVAGTNSDNIWSKNEISITIEVQPPFWKTWLFRVSTFLFIVFLIFGIFRYRINNIKNQKVALEKQVSERTFEIQEKNKLLTQQKEEIEARRMEEERKNQVLELQQNEIMLQKEELVIKNQLLFDSNEDIKASIRYAQSIQNSILPINHVVSKNFDHFIIFKPKDIVSGDFYWYSQIKDTFFLAVIDCTGHGVPGAFMSLIGYNLLNRIVNVFQIHSPKEIINTLDKELRIALQQNEKENNDGMELCLCKIQPTVPNEYLVTFSGAKRKLWAYHNDSNILAIYPAERRSIGGYHNIKPPAYTDRQIIMKSNDNLYLFSDGIVDQNAPNRKRFGSERLFKLLHSIATLPTQEQGEIIENELNSYQSNESQRDDITMWGIKLK